MLTINEELAEMMGALIGDGCISRYKTKDGRVRTFLLYSGHSDNDVYYYEKIVNPTFEKEFGTGGRLYKRKNTKSLLFWVGNEKAIAFFLGLGFPLGKKSKNLRVMPSISKDTTLMKACIRGIFNTDGSIYRRYSKKYSGHSKVYANYAVIQFKMKSKILLQQLRNFFKGINFNPNRISKVNDVYVLRLTSQNDIHRFMFEFSINHPHHIKRYQSICYCQKRRTLNFFF